MVNFTSFALVSPILNHVFGSSHRDLSFFILGQSSSLQHVTFTGKQTESTMMMITDPDGTWSCPPPSPAEALLYPNTYVQQRKSYEI